MRARSEHVIEQTDHLRGGMRRALVDAVVRLKLLRGWPVFLIVHSGDAGALNDEFAHVELGSDTNATQHPHQPVVIERVVFRFRRRDRHQRRGVEPLSVQGRPERSSGLVDRLFLVSPLRGARLSIDFLKFRISWLVALKA